MIEVLRAGPLTTAQDLGRVGYAHLGVPRSGAADTSSLRLANRLVGNPESACCLEFTLGGAALLFRRSTSFALTGAPAPTRLGGLPIPLGEWRRAAAGETLELDRPTYGLRTYLAVGGGFQLQPTLGSCSTDTLSGLGPAPLRAGRLLGFGTDPAAPPRPPDFVVGPVPGAGRVVLEYLRGPRDRRFAASVLVSFDAARWEVTTRSDRVGVRLSGPRILADRTDQLPSEGMALGSIEVPPSGQPIVLLADHPTTGGYPVLGVVDRAGIDVLAQSPPGTTVHFRRRR